MADFEDQTLVIIKLFLSTQSKFGLVVASLVADFGFWTLMANFEFQTLAAYFGFWTLMADFEDQTLVTDFRFWRLVAGFGYLTVVANFGFQIFDTNG